MSVATWSRALSPAGKFASLCCDFHLLTFFDEQKGTRISKPVSRNYWVAPPLAESTARRGSAEVTVSSTKVGSSMAMGLPLYLQLNQAAADEKVQGAAHHCFGEGEGFEAFLV